MQFAILLSFVASSSLPPCGLQSTLSLMPCYISLYVVNNVYAINWIRLIIWQSYNTEDYTPWRLCREVVVNAEILLKSISHMSDHFLIVKIFLDINFWLTFVYIFLVTLTGHMQAKASNGAVDIANNHLQPRVGIIAKASRTSKQAPNAQKHCKYTKGYMWVCQQVGVHHQSVTISRTYIQQHNTLRSLLGW